MYEMLTAIMENEEIQDYIDESEGQIMEASELLYEMSEVIKEEIMNNPNTFVVPGDREETMQNIIAFTEGAISSFTSQLVDLIYN